MSDARVLLVGEQDATMLDVGDRGRPPGDPPDDNRAWVEKVVGSNGGGLPRPEMILDDDFVEARVQLEFPNGKKGEPVVTIGAEVLEAMNGMWKQSMIVKVLGRNITLPVLNKKLKELWNPKGGMYAIDLPRQFFMIRFEKEEEYFTALTGGPWRAFGSHLLVQAWSPGFNPLRDEITTTPVWVRLSNIPLNFYHNAILMGIARGLGNPLRVDLATLRLQRARFARVCVAVDLSQPLIGSIQINGERYFVAYEGLSTICSGCGIYGHLVHNCPHRLIEQAAAVRAVEKVSKSGPVTDKVSIPVEDGFTVVGRRGKSNVAPARKDVVAAEKSNVNLGRNLQDISVSANMETVEMANQFGLLTEEVISEDLQEIGTLDASNKENEDLVTRQGKSGSQVKFVARAGPVDHGRNGPQQVAKDRRAGGMKYGNRNGPRPTQAKPQSATRGLVFNQMCNDIELSVSGKRLRGEEITVGRPGGVFVSDRQGQLGESIAICNEGGDSRETTVAVDSTDSTVCMQSESTELVEESTQA